MYNILVNTKKKKKNARHYLIQKNVIMHNILVNTKNAIKMLKNF